MPVADPSTGPDRDTNPMQVMADQHSTPCYRTPYSLIILAGGAGRRMQGADKGLLTLNGQPLVAHLLARFRQDDALVSANRNDTVYAQLGARVCADRHSGFQGPLAGVEACLPHALHQHCLIVPCDMPWLPENLPAMLVQARQTDADIAVLHDGERLQPLCMYLDRDIWQDDLSAYLLSGGRSVHGWLANKPLKEVIVHAPANAFRNLNTPDEWPV